MRGPAQRRQEGASSKRRGGCCVAPQGQGVPSKNPSRRESAKALLPESRDRPQQLIREANQLEASFSPIVPITVPSPELSSTKNGCGLYTINAVLVTSNVDGLTPKKLNQQHKQQQQQQQQQLVASSLDSSRSSNNSTCPSPGCIVRCRISLKYCFCNSTTGQ